jgi:hypothetical protein
MSKIGRPAGLRPAPPRPGSAVLPFAELAKRQGVVQVESLSELAQPDLWDSDEEYDALLAGFYASRRSGTA